MCIRDRITIDPQKIGDVVGKQGKVINKIIEETGVKIDISDDGSVSVCGTDKDMIARAIEIIKSIVTDIEPGAVMKGKVVRIMNFGAFVELAPNKDGIDVYKRQVRAPSPVTTTGIFPLFSSSSRSSLTKSTSSMVW